jgi:hypothetical protein
MTRQFCLGRIGTTKKESAILLTRSHRQSMKDSHDFKMSQMKAADNEKETKQ